MAYKIRIPREFYGPKTTREFLVDLDDYSADPIMFATKHQAQARADELDGASPYYLAYNESGRAVYTVVRHRGV